MSLAELILGGVRLWLLAGAAVAAAFLLVGIDRIDEDARGAYVFRPLLVPGVMLIWPLVLWRWWLLETGRDKWKLRHRPPRASHGKVWIAMTVLIPLILIAGLSARQQWPADYAPEQLDEAESAQ